VIKLLAIPVAGTIAAIVVILLAHGERQGAHAAPSFEPPPFHLPGGEPHGAMPEEREPSGPPTVAPDAEEVRLRLEPDGAFVDVDGEKVYASAAELAERLSGASHKLVITNGKGVGEEALDQALARLRDRFLVTKDYRAPEAQPEEEKPGEKEADK